MRLPFANNAVVPAEKLRDYLLSRSHPVGRFKAKFFATLGYGSDDWALLERDIRTLLEGDAAQTQMTAYGQKYEVRGMINGSAGRAADIVTVWIMLHGEHVPRFVTAYPGGKT